MKKTMTSLLLGGILLGSFLLLPSAYAQTTNVRAQVAASLVPTLTSFSTALESLRLRYLQEDMILESLRIQLTTFENELHEFQTNPPATLEKREAMLAALQNAQLTVNVINAQVAIVEARRKQDASIIQNIIETLKNITASIAALPA